MSAHAEYISLIQDTLLYLRESLNEISPPKQLEVNLKKPPVKKLYLDKMEEAREETREEKSIKTPKAVSEVSSSRSLSHLEMKALLSKVVPTTALFDLPREIYLFAFEENHRSFLESVATAISARFSKAQVLSIKNQSEALKYFQDPSTRLILSPLDALKGLLSEEKFKLASVNKLHPSLPLLALAPIENYLNDQNLKYALWNTLKNTLQSSPMPRSTNP